VVEWSEFLDINPEVPGSIPSATTFSEKLSLEWSPLNLVRIIEELKNGVFWDVTPCGSCKNRRFGGPKRRYLHEPHGVTSQKTPFFIVK
jgi:hypothetical protein